MGRKAKSIDRKDQLSISLRRDEYKKEVKKLLDKAKGKDVTDKVISAVKFFNKNQGRKDRTYREDEAENSNYKDYIQEDQNMKKAELIDFIREQWGEPDFKTHDGPIEEAPMPFLKGFTAHRLGVEVNDLEEGGLDFLRGIVAASEGQIDVADVFNDKVDRSRIDELKRQRLNIGEEQKLCDSLQKRVDQGEISKVEALKIQRKNVGEEVEDRSVEEIREDRIKKFQGED